MILRVGDGVYCANPKDNATYHIAFSRLGVTFAGDVAVATVVAAAVEALAAPDVDSAMYPEAVRGMLRQPPLVDTGGDHTVLRWRTNVHRVNRGEIAIVEISLKLYLEIYSICPDIVATVVNRTTESNASPVTPDALSVVPIMPPAGAVMVYTCKDSRGHLRVVYDETTRDYEIKYFELASRTSFVGNVAEALLCGLCGDFIPSQLVRQMYEKRPIMRNHLIITESDRFRAVDVECRLGTTKCTIRLSTQGGHAIICVLDAAAIA